MELSVEGVTVRSVEPQTDPAQAFTVTDPDATAKLLARFVASFVTVATVLSDELQITDPRV